MKVMLEMTESEYKDLMEIKDRLKEAEKIASIYQTKYTRVIKAVQDNRKLYVSQDKEDIVIGT